MRSILCFFGIHKWPILPLGGCYFVRGGPPVDGEDREITVQRCDRCGVFRFYR